VRLVFVLLGAGTWIVPRGQSAWRLHNLGTTLGDHALCMVGPTGPRLLREQPGDLSELLRLRIVLSAPDARPFARCTELADRIEMSVRARQAYSQSAAKFREYAGQADPSAGFAVADFDFGRATFEGLAEQAWPFVRGAPLRLIEGSVHGKEALHPLVPPKPGAGRGLPTRGYVARATLVDGDTIVGAFGSGANARIVVSKDGGRTFSPGGRERASDLLDRCLVDPGGPAFSLSRTDAGRHVVVSMDVDGAPTAALLGEADERVQGVSCDTGALVAVLRRGAPHTPAQPPLRFRLCPLRHACRDLASPPGLDLNDADVDIARLAGDTMVVAARGGISRVASSRDDGATWTPLTVAFDATSAGWPAALAPSLLLNVGDGVLLYGQPNRATGTYALLGSADHGASFRPL